MKSRLLLGAVLQKEFRSRMRGWRSPFMITLYLGLLALIGYAYFYAASSQVMYSGGFGPEIGLQMYAVMAVFQLLLIAFVTPALTAGAISGERERQTLPLLLCTRLSAAAIVLSKLLASISYILLLIFASLPVFSIVFLFGGVSLPELLQVLAVYLMTALTLGSVGIFASALTKKTLAATVLSYAVVFGLLVGTVMIGAYIMATNQGQPYLNPPAVLYANPLVALFSVLPFENGYMPIIGVFFSLSGAYPGAAPAKLLPPWQYNFMFDAFLIIVLLVASAYLIQPIKRRPRLFGRRKPGGEGVAPTA